MHKTDSLLRTLFYGIITGILSGGVFFVVLLLLEADSAAQTYTEYEYKENSRGQTYYEPKTVMRDNFDENIPANGAVIGFGLGLALIIALRYVPALPSVEQILDKWAGVKGKK